MPQETNSGLLPVGQEITFRDRGALRIIRQIGSGLTSEVYEGQLIDLPDQPRVALKARKELEFARAREFFKGEAEILAKLPGLEDEINPLRGLPTDAHVAAGHYGIGQHNSVEFLVMEFMTGRPITDLLEKSADGRLPEKQALTVGLYLFHTLDLLHSKLKRSYIDLKFENLWWEGPPESGRLRMTDFGTLEDIPPGNDRPIRRDLLVAGCYLCKMLIGFMPDFIVGELRDRPVPRIRRADASWGARQLLARLLHPNPEERPLSAVDVLTASWPDLIGLIDLVEYWGRPIDSLAAIKERSWTKGQNATGVERVKSLTRARAALDILNRRDATPNLEEVAALDELLQQSGDLTTGRGQFQARAYAEAERTFDRARRAAYEPDRVALFRRWSYLARIGYQIELPPDLRPDLERLVEHLSHSDWTAAGRRLDQLRPALAAAPAFALLEADLALYEAIDKADRAARDKDYTAAVEAYDAALEALEKMPGDKAGILKDETGPLLDERERLDDLARHGEKARVGEKAMKEADSLLGKGDRPGVLRAARRALVSEPIDVDARRADLLQLADRSLDMQDYVMAADLAALAFDTGQATAALRNRYRLAAALRQAESALEAGDTKLFAARVDTISRQTDGPRRLTPLLRRAGELAQKTHDAGWLRALAALEAVAEADRNTLRAKADAIDAHWRENAERNAREQRERLRPTVDLLINEAEHALYLAELDDPLRRRDLTDWRLETYLHYAGDHVEAVETAVNKARQAQTAATEADHRRDVADALSERANRLLREVEKNRQSGAAAALKARQDADDLRRKLDEMVLETAAPADPANREARAALLLELLRGCEWYLRRVDPDDVEVLAWREKARRRLDRDDPQAWATAQAEAGERLATFQSAFARAEEAFQSGRLDVDGIHLVDWLAPYAGSSEYAAIDPQIRRAAEWQSFSGGFAGRPPTPHQPDRLAGLRRWLPLERTAGLPAVFALEAPSVAWLEQTASAAADVARQTINYVDLPPAADRGSGAGYDRYNPTDWTPPTQAARAGPEAFLDTVKWWFSAAATRQLAQESIAAAPAQTAPSRRFFDSLRARLRRQESGDAPISAAGDTPPVAEAWDAGRFLAAVAAAALARDADRLQRVIAGGPFPADVDAALEELTSERWRVAVQSARPAGPIMPDAPPAGPNWQRFLPFALAGLVIVVIVLLFAFREPLGGMMGDSVGPTPTSTSTVPTPPQEGLAVVAPTATATLASTATATTTATATATVTATPTIAAPPAESSAFFLNADAAALAPAAPLASGMLWRLPPTGVPPLDQEPWALQTDEETGVEFSIIPPGAGTTGGLIWEVDQPLAGGWYQLYTLDTQFEIRGPQRFDVLLDDQAATPVIGSPEVIYNSNDGGQVGTAWLPLGVYDVAQGQRLSVSATADPDSDAPFAATPLLLARLEDRERELLAELVGFATIRPLAALLDDNRIELAGGQVGGGFIAGSSRWPEPAQTNGVWNGRYRAAELTQSVDVALRATWLPLGRLPAGRYQLYALLPAGSTALVEYQLTADGVELVSNPIPFRQRDHSPGWLAIGDFDLPAEAAVGVQMTGVTADNLAVYAGETVWNIGADAVALLRIED